MKNQHDDLFSSVNYFEIRIKWECIKPTDVATLSQFEYDDEMFSRTECGFHQYDDQKNYAVYFVSLAFVRTAEYLANIPRST